LTTTVATINASGLATAVAVGTSTIRAAQGAINNSKTLTVTAAALASITVTPASGSLAKGLTLLHTATGTYTDGSTANITATVTWTSSTTSVATINASGLATAVAMGTSTITATQGAINNSKTFTVTAPVLVSIAVTPATGSVAKGLTLQYTATGTYTDGSTANLTATVTWTSSASSVATINAAGLATAVAVGTSTITAAQGAINNSKTFTVTAPALVSIAVTPASGSVAKGLTLQYTATGTYTDGSTANITATSTWTSSATSVATINASGLATAVAVGTSTITATKGAITDSKTITVTAPVIVTINISPASASLPDGKTVQFTATGIYSDASTANVTDVATWSSTSPGIAQVSDVFGTKGLATAQAVGTTIIEAQIGAVFGSANLTVTIAVLETISVTPASASVAKGLTVQYTATGTYSDGSTANITATVTWTSSAASVATVNASGLATAVAVGTSSIKATKGAINNSKTITVTPHEVVYITMSPISPAIAIGYNLQFSATAHYTDALTQNVTGSTSWTSSNTAVASINSSGFAASNSLGTTTITAVYNGKTATTTLTVAAAVLDYITISPTDPVIIEGFGQQFTATAYYTDGSTVDVTASTSWSSSDTSVATINAAGLAQSNITGTTIITADYNGETATTVLTAIVEVVSWPDFLSRDTGCRSNSIDTDSMGHVVVTGYCSGSSDFNADGDTTDGPAETYTGTAAFIAKYTNKGTLLWVKRLGESSIGNAVTIDPSDNIIAGGSISAVGDLDGDWDADGIDENYQYGQTDYFITKLTPNGDPIWAIRRGGHDYDTVEAVATDPSGNVFFTGSGGEADLNGDRDNLDGVAESDHWGVGSNDMIVAKYTSSGSFLWAYRMGDNSDNGGTGITCDSSGNVIASGHVFETVAHLDGNTTIDKPYESVGAKGAGDGFITKFDPNGAFLWGKRIGGSSADNIRSVKTDASDNVIIVGYVQGNLSATEFIPADLNGDGDFVDASEASSNAGVGSDSYVSKFNSSGTPLWHKRLGRASDGNDQAMQVDTDASGNIVITGYTGGTIDLNADGDTADAPHENTSLGGDGDAWVTSFNSSGTFRWARRLGGFGGDTRDTGDAIAADLSGAVFVVGLSTDRCSGVNLMFCSWFVWPSRPWLTGFSSSGVPMQ
jgi:uncharacterized protein YjdB